MNKACFLASALLAGAAFAAPPAVEKLAAEMLESGAEVKAGANDRLGVFVVATGSALVGDSRIKAKKAARVNAVRRLGEFIGSQVSGATRHETSEVAVNGEAEVKEFFSSVTETQVKELLKGVQDFGTSEKDGEVVFAVYLTTKAVDASVGLQDALARNGDAMTVTAAGEGRTEDVAVQLALRSAVEQVVGTVVIGETKVSDDTVVMDRVFAGVQGFVDQYRITAETTVGIGVRVEIVAQVSKKKILDSYSKYMEALGNPGFYIASNSPDLTSRFTEFFSDMDIRVTMNRAEATYIIQCYGDYRNVTNPMNGRKGIQLSLRFKVQDVCGAEVFIDMKNDPKKSACYQTGGEDRQREICSGKAFDQMKQPLHEKIHKMVGKLMERHTNKLMNGDE